MSSSDSRADLNLIGFALWSKSSFLKPSCNAKSSSPAPRVSTKYWLKEALTCATAEKCEDLSTTVLIPLSCLARASAILQVFLICRPFQRCPRVQTREVNWRIFLTSISAGCPASFKVDIILSRFEWTRRLATCKLSGGKYRLACILEFVPSSRSPTRVLERIISPGKDSRPCRNAIAVWVNCDFYDPMEIVTWVRNILSMVLPHIRDYTYLV